MRAPQSFSLKPRISKSRKLWACESSGCLPGFGNTPKDAYDHWKRLQAEALKRLQDSIFDPMGGHFPAPAWHPNSGLPGIRTIA